jgi:hypothetical protein
MTNLAHQLDAFAPPIEIPALPQAQCNKYRAASQATSWAHRVQLDDRTWWQVAIARIDQCYYTGTGYGHTTGGSCGPVFCRGTAYYSPARALQGALRELLDQLRRHDWIGYADRQLLVGSIEAELSRPIVDGGANAA